MVFVEMPVIVCLYLRRNIVCSVLCGQFVVRFMCTFNVVVYGTHRQLKQEEKHCMEELQCNIVVIKGSCAKVLRLNLGGIHNKPLPPFSLSSSSSSHSPICSEKYLDKNSRLAKTASSPVEDAKKASPRPETKTVALSSNAAPTASFFVREHNPLFEKLHTGNLTPIEDVGSDGEGTADSEDNGGGSTGSTPLGLKLHYDACEYLVLWELSCAFCPHLAFGRYIANTSLQCLLCQLAEGTRAST